MVSPFELERLRAEEDLSKHSGITWQQRGPMGPGDPDCDEDNPALMSFSDDDAISSGDDFSLYPGTFGRHRPLPEDRLFYDTVDEISLKIINCEHIC